VKAAAGRQAVRAKVHPAAPPAQVRIIGGQWKRSKLPVPDLPGLRPTPDRVRVTLFNWLGNDLTGWRCLDAFAGSGALGFEAASRGAAEVLLLERDAAQARRLRESAARLQAINLRVEQAEAIGWMARADSQRWDLILLDPPFESALAAAALQAAQRLVTEDGLIYLESDTAPDHEQLALTGLAVHRQSQAGRVWFQLLTRSQRSHGPSSGDVAGDPR
jgi:16S rRNA (guanine966-N2)-methyltransferase